MGIEKIADKEYFLVEGLGLISCEENCSHYHSDEDHEKNCNSASCEGESLVICSRLFFNKEEAKMHAENLCNYGYKKSKSVTINCSSVQILEFDHAGLPGDLLKCKKEEKKVFAISWR